MTTAWRHRRGGIPRPTCALTECIRGSTRQVCGWCLGSVAIRAPT